MKIKTIGNLIKEAENRLKDVDISTFSLDAKILLSYVLKLNTSECIIFKSNEEVSEKVHSRFIPLLERRLKFEPIAYIIGYKHFWKQVYKVNKNVLIPRPETELIIEVILKKLKDRKNEKLRILNLGTGSGCIILSLLSELKNSSGIAVDISDKALNIAKINANKFQLNKRVEFIKSDWFDSLNTGKKFDIIVSNPPYISKKEWRNLEINVRNFEPTIALTDNTDGLKNYKIITQKGKEFLKDNGIIALELGCNQKNSIQNIFNMYGYDVKFYKDLQCIDRVAITNI